MLHSEGLVLRGLPADFPHRDPYTECQKLAVEVWHERGVDGIEFGAAGTTRSFARRSSIVRATPCGRRASPSRCMTSLDSVRCSGRTRSA
jgi:hypothetical protein